MTPAPTFVKTPAHRHKIQQLLHAAIRVGDAARAKRLLSQGADPAIPFGPSKSTPLMAAAAHGSAALIELFLPFSDIADADADGCTPLRLLMQLLASHSFQAPPLGWRPALLSLLSRETATRKANDGSSPFLFVAKHWRNAHIEFDEIISILSPFSDLSSADANGLTPTALAMSPFMTSSCSRALALFNLDPLQEQCLLLPLHAAGNLAHVAANNDRVDFLCQIAHRADLRSRDPRGRTLLMASAATGSFGCMEFLLANGADPLCVDSDGCDALMLSIERRDFYLGPSVDEIDCSRLLPLIHQSNLAARDRLGESAIDKARARGLVALADLMGPVSGGRIPPPPEAEPSRAPSPAPQKLQELLGAAIRSGQLELVDRRLLQGADPSGRIPIPGIHPETPLMLACLYDNAQIIRRLAPLSDPLAQGVADYSALTAFLISAEIDCPERLLLLAELVSPAAASIANHLGAAALGAVRASDEFLSPAMDLLSFMSNWDAASARGQIIFDFHGDRAQLQALALLRVHPDPEKLLSVANHEGQTALHLAARAGALSFLSAAATQKLLSSTDSSGHTPLMSACSKFLRGGELHSIAALLAPWSNCRAVDPSGCDALMLAIEAPFLDPDNLVETVKILAPLSDLRARDFLGESALDKALSYGLKGAASVLQAFLDIHDERDTLAAASSPPSIAAGLPGPCPPRLDAAASFPAIRPALRI